MPCRLRRQALSAIRVAIRLIVRILDPSREFYAAWLASGNKDVSAVNGKKNTSQRMRKTLVVLSKKGLTLSDKSVVLLWLASAVVAFLVYFYHIQNPAPCEEPVVVEPRLQHLTGEPVELEQ